MKQQTKKTLSALLLCALLCAALAGCKKDAPQEEDSSSSEAHTTAPAESDASISAFTATFTASGVRSDFPSVPALLTVDGQPVTYDEYRYAKLWYRDYVGHTDQGYWDANPEQAAAAEEAILAQIKKLHAVFSEAERLGLALTGEEIKTLDDTVAQQIEDAGSEAALRAALANYGETLWFYYYYSAYEALSEKLQNAYAAAKSNEEVLAFGKTEDVVRFKQISLLRNESGSNESAIKTQMNEIAARLQSGEDFDTLLREFSAGKTDAETAERKLNAGFINQYPDGLLRSREVLSVNVSDVLFSLKEGERSGVVRTDYGYSVLWRLPKTDAFLSEQLDELRSLMAEGLLEKNIDAVAADMPLEYGFSYDRYKNMSLDS